MIKDHGPKGRSTANPSSDSTALGKPGPLKAIYQAIQDGVETVLVDPDPNESTPPSPSDGLVKGYITGFPVVMAGNGIDPDLLKNLSTGVQLYGRRLDIPLQKLEYLTPDNADTLLRPAIDWVFKNEGLLREELPSVMRKENLPEVQTAVSLIDGYAEAVAIVEPFYLGLLGRLRQAQWVADGCCRRIWKEGSPTILAHAILGNGVSPLQLLCTQTAQKAQDTALLTQTVAHQIEQEVLVRVEAELKRLAALQQQGQTPLVGAHAPGETAVPPGAMPLTGLSPQHPKPKRRGTGGATGKGKPGSPAPKKGTKKSG